MFGKKEPKKIKQKEIKVNAIPDEFYGGVDPVIKFKEVEKEIKIRKKQTELTESEKKSLERKTVVGAGQKSHPVNLLTNTKFLVLLVFGLFVLFIGVASAYYFIQFKKQSNEVIPPAPVITPKPTPPAVEEPEPVDTTIDIPTTTPPEDEMPEITKKEFIEFPSVLLGLGLDLDDDGLSDLSEEVFNTDSGMVDSDDDTFTDVHELYYLYNPAGFKPLRLIDSGLMKEFRNPIFGFRMYYPKDWVIGNVDQTYKQSLINAPNGEYIEIHTVSLDRGETFVNWFGKNATNQKLSNLEEFETRFEEVGLKRKDGLVYYFQDDRNNLYILLYKTTDKKIVNYKTVLEVMCRSFRLFNNTIVIPLELEEENLEDMDWGSDTVDEIVTSSLDGVEWESIVTSTFDEELIVTSTQDDKN